MGILRKVKPTGNHVCQPPKDPENMYGTGTIWECDVCGKQFRLENDQREGWIWVVMLESDYLPGNFRH